jgi:tetratricopeptide (TPR) repeat protein
MKKYIINYQFSKLGLLFGILLFASCQKSFLDLKPYNASVLSDAIKSEADLNAAVNGLYASLRATDFYGRTFAVKGDLMADHAFLSSQNSGRYTGFNLYNMVVTDGYASNIWFNAYQAIKNANLIINSGLAITNDNISQLFSEAYAIRGMVYFDLCRNYALPYAKDPNGPGVPIVLSFDQNAKPARSSIKDVYAQAISDLNKAYSLAKFNQGTTMTFQSTGQSRSVNSSFCSKYAISGLLAKVYQHMGDWTNAKNAALDVVNNGGFSLVPSTGFVNYWKGTTPRTDRVETMFEVTSDANNSVSDGTLANLYVPKPIGSYGDILATQDFYNSHSLTDVRRQLYNPSTRSGQLGIAYYITKYPIDPINYDDVKIVRYAEVLLILSEAYYNLNDPINALKYLNMVAMQRDPVFTGYTSTGPQILEDILTERGKELAWEGYRFWDFYRLQRSFVKPQAQDASNAIIQSITVTPTTLNIIFPIPKDEVLVNPNITQNNGY